MSRFLAGTYDFVFSSCETPSIRSTNGLAASPVLQTSNPNGSTHINSVLERFKGDTHLDLYRQALANLPLRRQFCSLLELSHRLGETSARHSLVDFCDVSAANRVVSLRKTKLYRSGHETS